MQLEKNCEQYEVKIFELEQEIERLKKIITYQLDAADYVENLKEIARGEFDLP